MAMDRGLKNPGRGGESGSIAEPSANKTFFLHFILQKEHKKCKQAK